MKQLVPFTAIAALIVVLTGCAGIAASRPTTESSASVRPGEDDLRPSRPRSNPLP